MIQNMDSVRLDKWLWAARFFKSRSLATEAITLGRVHVNDSRVKPAHPVKLGERVRVQRGHERLEVLVRMLSDVRRSAPLAQLLYEETPESVTLRQEVSEARRLYTEPARAIRGGRPTKRERRQIERFTRDE
ncbi:RNA-binding S4 domain-containing protein [Orrella sp. 11846]|uniref:RNA-binding S4 domain-containing protein n=1 Tax=Orrella sp. 11846 TaxID=3409913 RepID=UPI003B5CE90A